MLPVTGNQYMPINKNHEFEELDGVKCAIVERNATKERTTFLKNLLEYNNFEVVVITSPLPKIPPAPNLQKEKQQLLKKLSLLPKHLQ
ncbi:MAG: hypothetical protein HC867_05980 [Bacteroidia bacterium]|nr:hypothetical protein [Bacteroidia bacterium]